MLITLILYLFSSFWHINTVAYKDDNADQFPHNAAPTIKYDTKVDATYDAASGKQYDTTEEIILAYVSRERRSRDLRHIIKEHIPFEVKFNGLFRTAAYYDTRQVFGELDKYEMFLPAEAAIGRNGLDINARGGQNIVPSDSRLIMTVLGPEVSGAVSWGLLEADFLGVGNTIDFDLNNEFLPEGTFTVPLLNRLLRDLIPNRFNVRRLFFRLDWDYATLLLGQEFHPFVLISAPNVLAFNSGAPFAADSRSAQLRIELRSKHFQLTLTVLSERQFLHNGPTGPSSAYYQNSLSPMLNAMIKFFFGNQAFGAGINYERLTPRLLTFKEFPVIFTREIRDYASVSGICATAFGEFHFYPLSFFCKINYLQNAENFQMFSGYAVHSIDEDTDKRKYTNLTACSLWGELVLDKYPIEPAVFIGYSKNLGAQDSIITSRFIPNDLVYALFPNVDQAWRISPRIRWYNGPVVFGLEAEYTGAIYGRLANSGKIVDQEPAVHNVRLLAMFDYYF